MATRSTPEQILARGLSVGKSAPRISVDFSHLHGRKAVPYRGLPVGCSECVYRGGAGKRGPVRPAPLARYVVSTRKGSRQLCALHAAKAVA
jgi:hypothetical protein